MRKSPTSESAASGVIKRLRRLANNLWWTWSPDATALMAGIDPPLFAATNQNPVRMLNLLTPERSHAMGRDAQFLDRLDLVEKQLDAYLSARTWYLKSAPRSRRPLKVAYFCAEFAVHDSLPQYSGGLGVLAGDHVKSASDLGLPLVGVGLLYQRGFYKQEFAPDGSTRVIYPDLNFAELPLEQTGKVIRVPMASRNVAAQIWRQTVGRVPLYLLDTDIPLNKPADRKLTHHLYGGNRTYRIGQEILLGVGGVMALDAVKQTPTVVHMNEGHAAFAALERVARLTRAGMALKTAIGRVAASTVFTTHTPVPAGNDRFDPKLAMKYLGRYARDLRMTDREFLGLGRENPRNDREEFCMTVLALRLSRHCNGVSALHAEVSREMWKNVYGATNAAKVPIRHVTNGVHTQTWLAPEFYPLYDKYLKPNWLAATDRPRFFSRASRIPDDELWELHASLKRKLVNFVRDRLTQQVLRQSGSPQDLRAAADALREDALTIGFARRFASYKRAPLIFKDARRLAAILGHSDRPVQIVFAGKAHPKDEPGQEFAREIHRYARQTVFRGRVVLLENYDMNIARHLVGGCDVWLNNPLRPQEASGTSGMKPPLHGGLNCSILDGWWPECYDGRNGWAIGDGSQLADRRGQDRLDAERIYALLETRIVPLYYDRDASGRPRRWIARMKHSIETVGNVFNTHRMVGQYLRDFYLPASIGRPNP
jgi:glycogen phosphorylase